MLDEPDTAVQVFVSWLTEILTFKSSYSFKQCEKVKVLALWSIVFTSECQVCLYCATFKDISCVASTHLTQLVSLNMVNVVNSNTTLCLGKNNYLIGGVLVINKWSKTYFSELLRNPY